MQLGGGGGQCPPSFIIGGGAAAPLFLLHCMVLLMLNTGRMAWSLISSVISIHLHLGTYILYMVEASIPAHTCSSVNHNIVYDC